MSVVGIFDSGLGGLSILDKARQQLPQHRYLYVADTAYVPYGNKSDDAIQARSQYITQWLIQQGADVVVMACNTATAVAIDSLRRQYVIPFVGIEPALKTARQNQSKETLVLATQATLNSQRFDRLMQRWSPTRLITHACTGWVELVEQSVPDQQVYDQVAQHLQKMTAQTDTIILGCTHYSFLLPFIRRYLDNHWPELDPDIINPNTAVVKQLSRFVTPSITEPAQFYTTHYNPQLEQVTQRLLQQTVCYRSLETLVD